MRGENTPHTLAEWARKSTLLVACPDPVLEKRTEPSMQECASRPFLRGLSGMNARRVAFAAKNATDGEPYFWVGWTQ